jgi:hypothetical protein
MKKVAISHKIFSISASFYVTLLIVSFDFVYYIHCTNMFCTRSRPIDLVKEKSRQVFMYEAGFFSALHRLIFFSG